MSDVIKEKIVTYVRNRGNTVKAMDGGELIRCKDCKYRCETEDGEYNPEDIVCTYWMSDGLSETDYCSYGERRDNATD